MSRTWLIGLVQAKVETISSERKRIDWNERRTTNGGGAMPLKVTRKGTYLSYRKRKQHTEDSVIEIAILSSVRRPADGVDS